MRNLPVFLYLIIRYLPQRLRTKNSLDYLGAPPEGANFAAQIF